MNFVGRINKSSAGQLMNMVGKRSFGSVSNSYTLPPLPYDFGALEPVISGDIMKLHYEKHHQAYVNNLNIALDKYAACEAAKNIAGCIALQPAIKFNGGGHVNHSIFWTNLAPKNAKGGVAPTGPLADAINQQYGSLEKFIEKFNTKTAAIQGSGWGWLGYCNESKRLLIHTCANQDPLTDFTPLLGIDVWEHAYYLQSKNARPEYLKNIWQVVNWSNVAERYDQARKKL
ncbi:superoxide dismutase [Heterostelium album PN500]|uniref:Superoxide dismutase n=1 Tax=Heterostelium pallidum (strain ATCC 26659 / Pp 5 / PN500) TaxID=670386 RepID=D3BU03_HETP5|nr:superoxide dismutase [Heterostelium album PN500]EFA75189.1 superoxide dismutase [Heterostelium album PN500]|eukprot:XP_020427323.1 superoxide dismutase [Heterostelium album PN500]